MCCFCGQKTDITPSGDGLMIIVTRNGSEAAQQFYAHSRCIGASLNPAVPFEADPCLSG